MQLFYRHNVRNYAWSMVKGLMWQHAVGAFSLARSEGAP